MDGAWAGRGRLPFPVVVHLVRNGEGLGEPGGVPVKAVAGVTVVRLVECKCNSHRRRELKHVIAEPALEHRAVDHLHEGEKTATAPPFLEKQKKTIEIHNIL